MYPAQFGRNLVLTPHTYLLNAATVLTDTLYLDAQGYNNAVFVIKISGALSTSTYAKVLFRNGTQAKNVFWKVDGATDINDYSEFKGTIICNNGGLTLKTGVKLDGRAITTTGSLSTSAVTVTIPSACIPTGITSIDSKNEIVSIYPNPFSNSVNISINDASQINKTELKMYNVLGEMVLNTVITNQTITIETGNLPSGIYTYKLISNNTLLQAGRLVSTK